jgi:hypothetical protein
MDYKNKYLKYKTKYLELIQKGGTFDDVINFIRIHFHDKLYYDFKYYTFYVYFYLSEDNEKKTFIFYKIS